MVDTFEYTHVLYSSSCDMNGRWKLSSVIDAMLTTADRHNELLKCSRNDLLKQDLAWVLFKTVLQTERYPRIGERIRVRTFTKAPFMQFVPRYYELVDENETVISRAGSFWVLRDIRTKERVLPQQTSVSLPENPDRPAPVNLLVRPQNIGGETETAKYLPSCSDIDVNGHVNNIRYADWLANALGYETMREKAFRSVIMEYYHESLPGCELENRLTRSEDLVSYQGFENGRNNFTVFGRLTDRTLCS